METASCCSPIDRCAAGAGRFRAARDRQHEQQRTLHFLERLLAQVLEVLGGLGSDEGYGQHVALLFSEPTDFLRYIGHYYPDEGHFAQPGGIFIDDTYRHLAMWALEVDALRPTLAHELTHCGLADLPIPVWLDEAVAMEVQGALTGTAPPGLDRGR